MHTIASLCDLETSLLQRMHAASVPGAAVAFVREGDIAVLALGVTASGGTHPVGEATVFDVASLSKPVAAYIALQLADSGVLDLDRPLRELVGHGVAPDAAAAPITARHVLTHTSGLPNLRNRRESAPMRTHFAPGSWFSYSSVGFGYLQAALEALEGESLEQLARRMVFAPLAMHSSSFVWQARFDADFARPHDGRTPLEKHRADVGHASYSLQTTAADYARFMRAVLAGDGLSPSTRSRWLSPVVQVPHGDATHLEGQPPATNPGVAWGLGWGVETPGGAFFQWGKMDGIRAFAMGSPETRSAVVLLTNSQRGLRLMDAVADAGVAGPHPAIDWLRACVTE